MRVEPGERHVVAILDHDVDAEVREVIFVVAFSYQEIVIFFDYEEYSVCVTTYLESHLRQSPSFGNTLRI